MQCPTILFEPQALRLQRIYDGSANAALKTPSLFHPKIDEIYGPLAFSPIPPNRPLAYASYVMSVDGKIAFEDDEAGPLIAKNNFLDPNGAKADFWILSLLRANSQGIVIGCGTMIKEPAYSGNAYDPDLLAARQQAGMPPAPWTIIVTRSGRKIPYQNPVFADADVPFLILTCPNGAQAAIKEMNREFFLLPRVFDPNGPEKIAAAILENPAKIAIAATGENDAPDATEAMRVLRAMGIDKILVESPSYACLMMREGLLDEIFITTSCLFVCGQAMSIGATAPSYSSNNHPHCKILTIHMHGPHFLYTRYALEHGNKAHAEKGH